MAKIFKRKRYADRDYSRAMLPHSRREVFFDVLKLNWQSFVAFGCLVFLCALPLYLVDITEILAVSQATAQAQNLQGEALREAIYEIYGTKNGGAFLRIPCILLIFALLSGLIRVIRQYAWEENVRFGTDFAAGFKANIGHTLLLGVLIGLIYAINVYNYNSVQVSGGMMVMVFLPMGASVLVGIPVAAYALVGISIYAMPFRQLLHMSFLVFAEAPLKTLGALLCCMAPFGILLIPNLTVMIAGRILLSLLLPVILLGWFLFAMNRLDEVVNSRLHPQIMGKGLVKDETN